MKKKNILIFTTILFLLISCSSESHNSENEKVIGVKIYNYVGNFNTLFNKWQNIGINTVFASVNLLSNSEFHKLAEEFNIKTFVILPIFYAPEELAQDSSLYAITQNGEKAEEEWVQFVCPSEKEFVKNKIEFIKKFVKNNNPTGISLDFIRHFTFWEKVYPDKDVESLTNTCFDEKCIKAFCKNNNIEFQYEDKSANEIYNWIQNEYFDTWVKWKSNLITGIVKSIVDEVKIINPNIKVNLHAVPWRQKDFNGAINNIIGQDFKSLAEYVDYISPMTYSHMVKREPTWINSVVKDIEKISGVKILPSIQVSTAYIKNKLEINEFRQCFLESLKEPSSGVIFWNWDALSSDDAKLNLVKKHN